MYTHRARQVLSVAAWAMLGWVALGYVSTIPAVDRWLTVFERTGVGRVSEGLFLVVLGLTGITLWVAAIWEALTSMPKGSVRRPFLLVVLVAGNFVAAFFYYFLHVFWRPEPRLERRQKSAGATDELA